MSAPSPVIAAPPEHKIPEQLTLRPKDNAEPIRMGPQPVSWQKEIVRSLPMLGIGGIVATCIVYPPNVVGGVVLIGAEIALGAFAVHSWFPNKNK
jgi:hypothetical protein